MIGVKKIDVTIMGVGVKKFDVATMSIEDNNYIQVDRVKTDIALFPYCTAFVLK